jgi:Ca-activated chloride channel family protein
MTVQPGRCFALALLALLAAAGSVRAQGIIIDRRTVHPIARSYEVREVNLDARVRDQVAEVQVSQTFHNPGSFPIDAEYLFPLPEEGAVQNFVLLVDGQELTGRLMAKDEARRIYEEIVRTRRDPALLEYMGRGLYRTSVFPIPPGADRKVTMRYTQLCKRDRDVVEFAYPFSTQKFTAKPIERLSLTLRIESKAAIKSLYCPTYDAHIDRIGDHEAKVTWEQRDTIPSVDFRLITTLAEGRIGASVLSYRPSESEDGYFLLLASPEVKVDRDRHQPKTVIFVLDRSGSMAGKKIEQARNALKFVLNNLRDDDLFNIVVYDDRVETFKPELQRYSPSSRDEAVRYVENIREGGSTNIDTALKEALEQVRNDDRPSYALFLTDGLPTAGEMKESAIADHCKSANRYRTRLFAFGVGYDVNARLLDRLSGGNSGTSEYVKPDDDIEKHVATFYARLTSPVLADIRVELDRTNVNRTYPRDVPDLFEGGQLVLAGRYTRSGRTTLRISGKVSGERKSFEFPDELAEAHRGSGHEFVEKLWATRRVGDLIDQIDLHGQNKELVDELIALSTKYGLLTPYTTFLADDRVSLHASNENRNRTRGNLEALQQTTGYGGVAQRGMKQDYLAAQRAATPSGAPGAMGGPGMSSSASGLGLPGMMSGTGGGAGGPGPGAGTYAYDAGHAQPGQNASSSGMSGMYARRGSVETAPSSLAKAAGNQPPGGIGQSAGRADNSSLNLSIPFTQGSANLIAGKRAESNGSVVANVRQVGTKTFFRKDNRWVDSTVKPDEEAKAQVVRQFSDEFFKLAREQSTELNQYLTFDETVIVRLGTQVYRIEMAAK